MLCVTVGQWRHSACRRVSPWDSTPEGGPSIWHQPQTPASAQELQVKYAAWITVVERVHLVYLCVFSLLHKSHTAFPSSLVRSWSPVLSWRGRNWLYCKRVTLQMCAPGRPTVEYDLEYLVRKHCSPGLRSSLILKHNSSFMPATNSCHSSLFCWTSFKIRLEL